MSPLVVCLSRLPESQLSSRTHSLKASRTVAPRPVLLRYDIVRNAHSGGTTSSTLAGNRRQWWHGGCESVALTRHACALHVGGAALLDHERVVLLLAAGA
ncbi:hypothetical protein VFPFJ_04008 [Purpureocillium lilacinum]|uniref:Uncharacterized protein n=1 Tax=Purpureocillium lilacinum TaxID=33203 RepID=A0A179GXK2_PURLI|nr:hypothetical protein VFPFJ_04008 [Purpureocillium lilacinum]OAQ82228.1 hypothetical protein VFPBJ_04812 [Purpureocillium lilacinum]OAQ92268.1 hypothetical protein VFPFJ_04008 [Purpureocillium lilacinum]